MLEAYLRERSLREIEARLPGEAEQAKEELGPLIEEAPGNAHALFVLARCQLLLAESDQARETLETLLSYNPDHVSASIELAKACIRDGELREAIRLLSGVTSARSDIVEAWALLGTCLKREGQSDASEDAMKQYAMIKAFNEKLLVAQQAFANAEFQKADSICRHLLTLVPNEMRALRLLARIARQFGHYEFSTATLANCVATRPASVSIGLEYAYSLLASRMYAEALEQCDKLIEQAPELIDSYDLKAELLYHLGRYQEAIDLYRNLAELPERRAMTSVHLGKVLKTIGETSEAIDCYKAAIEVNPAGGQGYWELADLKTYRFSDDEVTAMRGLLDAGALPVLDKVMVEFSLGRALEGAGEFEESFQHYETANNAYKALRPVTYVDQNERFMSFFTTDYFAERKEQGNDSSAPIFIVSLPRSGSTLVEQILSRHSMIDATRELDEIVSIARAVNDPSQAEQGQYPYVLASVGAERIEELARRYLDHVGLYREQAPHFIDKAPHNFLHIGLIKTLFPNARIIDVRRNPMASGWSLYRQFFADSYLFSYDLESIGRYYNDYIALMNHWHAVLPGEILTISYEDLVNDLPTTVESMLRYCGLEFEEACLSFHLNERAVATPSSEQVRQPLYNTALDHWKNYEAFLEPLQRAVEGADQPADS